MWRPLDCALASEGHARACCSRRVSTADSSESGRLPRYDNGGASAVANSLSSERGGGGGGRDRRCTFSAIKDEGLGSSGAPAYITVRTETKP